MMPFNSNDGATAMIDHNAEVSLFQRIPMKTFGFSMFLFLVGVGLFISGVYVLCLHGPISELAAFFVLSFLTIVPGTYSLGIIFGTLQGWEGYSFYQIPTFDDKELPYYPSNRI